MSKLMKRAATAGVLAVALAGSTLAFGTLAGGSGAGRSQADDDHAVDVAGQNHLDHHAHLQEMQQIAAENGLEQAPEGGLCDAWFQFRTGTGLHCSPGPMTRDMFTEEQLAPTPHTAADARASGQTAGDPVATSGAFESTPRVACIGNGTDGKRVQMVYARRANQPDQFVSTATQVKWWASDIEEIMLESAQQTDGSRRVRFVTDGLCSAKVLNVVVPNTVSTFSQLVAAMEAKGYSSASRKYLIAWDDGDGTGSFCGLGEVWNDSSPGLSNRNESQPSAQFAAVENSCWTSSVAAHELMHTLGAVQDDAPNASSYGHCTDEYDVMCYVDGPGVVMRNICAYEQEDLYDCNHDDYFHTKPGIGSYLATHWNTANSGWLDKTTVPVPPDAPRNMSASSGAESVTVSWAAPLFDGGSPVLAYEVAVGTIRKVVGAGSLTATVTGVPDGTMATIAVRAVNVAGLGAPGSSAAMPSPPVVTRVTTPGGETIADIAAGPTGSVYVARTDRIVRVEANGTASTVVQGPGAGEGTAPLATTVHPGAVATYGDDLYWYDTVLHTVRRLRSGTVTTIAGNGTEGTAGNGGPATAAELRVHRIAIGPPSSGTEPRIHLLDKVGSNVRTFIAGSTIASSAGIVGQAGYAGDNWTATEALLNAPNDIAASSNGWVYVADTGNHRIRSFTTGGKIYTDIGNGTTTLGPSPTQSAISAVPSPAAIDWSADKGLLIESGGVIRTWEGGNLIRLAGDPFTAGASDADGTLAGKISYRKADVISAVTWSAGNLAVLANGPDPSTSTTRSRLRTATHVLTEGPTSTPSQLVAAPRAAAGAGSATVTWVPASNGGRQLSGYTVTASPGGKTVFASGTATNAVVDGLTVGTSYTFKVRASAPGGAAPDSAASNAVVPTATPLYLPFGSWTNFVDAHYLAVMGRAPRSDERTTAVQALTTGTTTKAAFIVSLRRSSENKDNVDPVARLYRAFLARTPDAEGLQFWIKRRRTGTWNLTRMADSFATSSEFTRKYGSLTNRQFVTRIYTDVLGRTADTSGVDYWTKKLDTKTRTRGGVMVGFSESSEYQRKQAANTDLAAAYILLVQHAPTTYDENWWRPKLEDGTKTYDDLVGIILDSDEYLIRMSG